ncbi:MAG: NupC/NupG family nucleoside CNT transporter [Planctomycetes bacterium]|nr:NupC/NupG family nucleoside CNT transporter [Planctomycetota bacterium]
MERMICLLGLVVFIALAWLMSSHKRQFPWRIVLGGLGLQIAFALLILKTSPGQMLFATLGAFFQAVINCTDVGTAFMFDIYPHPGDELLPPQYTLWRCFAFGVLPTIILFSSLMGILYHLGIMQRIVSFFAFIMQKTLGTSGAETLSAAANIFVGQTEAPLVVRPYVARMTLSELNVVMVGGFATIAGGVLAIFIRVGIDPGHLITASVISAPAALLIAKVMQPETEHSQTIGHVKIADESKCENVIEAAAEGASTGMQLAINVAAMLIAFVALVAMIDLGFGWLGTLLGYEGEAAWTLNKLFGMLFAPFAWLMGIPWQQCQEAGSLLGTKMVVNEVLAYYQLTEAVERGTLDSRSVTLMTYALCGFANFGSIGIQLGGIGGIAPERRSDLAKLGFRAMLGGTLAAFMTACVAGLLL